MHFDGVEGNPAWAARVEQAVRESLTVRNPELWPADSLARLKERGEWAGSERDARRIGDLARRTRTQAVAWMRTDAPQGQFQRPWWSVLWTRRVWTTRADLYVADATGKPKVTRLALERKVWLGFTGTNGADLWPVTEPERSSAEAALIAELAGKAAQAITDSETKPTE